MGGTALWNTWNRKKKKTGVGSNVVASTREQDLVQHTGTCNYLIMYSSHPVGDSLNRETEARCQKTRLGKDTSPGYVATPHRLPRRDSGSQLETCLAMQILSWESN